MASIIDYDVIQWPVNTPRPGWESEINGIDSVVRFACANSSHTHKSDAPKQLNEHIYNWLPERTFRSLLLCHKKPVNYSQLISVIWSQMNRRFYNTLINSIYTYLCQNEPDLIIQTFLDHRFMLKLWRRHSRTCCYSSDGVNKKHMRFRYLHR